MRAICFCIVLCYTSSFAQRTNDSLWQVWSDKSLHDTIRLKAIDDCIWNNYMYSDPDSGRILSELMLSFARSAKKDNYIDYALNNIGTAYYFLGKHKEAIVYYNQGLQQSKKMKNQRRVAVNYVNLANVYDAIGDVRKAIGYYMNSLAVFEKIGDEGSAAICLCNIGSVYDAQKDFVNAENYFKRCLKLNKKTGNTEGFVNALNLMGVLNHKFRRFSISLSYYRRALPLAFEINNDQSKALTYLNMSQAYDAMKQYDSFFVYSNLSLTLYDKIGDRLGVATNHVNQAWAYSDLANEKASLEHAHIAYTLANETSSLQHIKESSELLYSIYKKKNNSHLSLKYYEEFIRLRDSLESDQNKRALIHQQFKYEYDKKSAADSVRTIEERKIAAIQLQQEKTQRITLYGFLMLTLVFAVFMFSRFRKTRRQKLLIEEQKRVVEEQKLLVEEKQKEIIDSIHYAKRIQSALLPNDKYISKSLKKIK